MLEIIVSLFGVLDLIIANENWSLKFWFVLSSLIEINFMKNKTGLITNRKQQKIISN